MSIRVMSGLGPLDQVVSLGGRLSDLDQQPHGDELQLAVDEQQSVACRQAIVG